MLKPKTRWIVRSTDFQGAEALAKELKMTPLIASMLINRGIDTVDAARYFLFAENEFHDPYLFAGMERAVQRIKEAIHAQEPILIFGDYDADGVSSTTVLMITLRDLGANVQFYIPNRFLEGYGPNEEAFRYASENGIKVIITVDTGIAAVNEANVAKELGMDLIITDHHEPGPVLPEALAIIHPKLPESTYPFRELAGVGVAFKLAHALYGEVPEHLFEIAVIGTIADLVSLTGENRLLVKKGLEKLRSTKNLGLRAIFKVAGVEPKSINEETIGFTLGPRINAAGRLEDADLAVKLLLTTDEVEAQTLAGQMENLNKMRQSLVNTIAEEAVEEIEKHFSPEETKVLVIGKEGWNPGVIGIVASRLVEKYYRPAIVLSCDEETGLAKGSARSIAGFDLFKNLSACREMLPHFGGHPMAAGLTIKIADMDELRSRLNQLAAEQLTAEDLTPVTWLDSRVDLSAIDLKTLEEMERLSPFGVDNPKPRLLIDDVQISSMRKIGSEQNHLKMTIEHEGSSLDGVGFGLGSLADQISPLARLSLIGELSINEWNNIRKPQIFIQDMAVDSWQLFDFRGGHRFNLLEKIVPKDNRKWILFEKHMYEKFPPVYQEEAILVETKEDAESLELNGKNVIFVDMPSSKELMSGLIKGKNPARIYAYFFKKSSDFLSTLPTREHFKWYYAFLVKQGEIDLNKYGEVIAKKRGWSGETIFFMSRVFSELDFVTINNGFITLNRKAPKRDLTDSITYRMKQEQFSLENELLFSSYRQLKNWFDQHLLGSVMNEEANKEWI